MAERNHAVTRQLISATAIAEINNEQFFKELANYINDLVIHDFEYLITLLYRIDVNEKKVRTLLATQKDANAGELIAHLMIERQVQKIRSREQFKPPTNIPEEEKW